VETILRSGANSAPGPNSAPAHSDKTNARDSDASPHRKMKKDVLKQSLAWIRNHPDATNMDVPDDLVSAWIFEDDEAEPKPAGFYFAVFTFGFLQRSIFSSSLPKSQPRSVPVSVVFENFGIWQMKLGLAEIHRKTELQIGPMSLLAFPDDEQITYRPKRDGER
jgi:hypothetical protein